MHKHDLERLEAVFGEVEVPAAVKDKVERLCRVFNRIASGPLSTDLIVVAVESVNGHVEQEGPAEQDYPAGGWLPVQEGASIIRGQPVMVPFEESWREGIVQTVNLQNLRVALKGDDREYRIIPREKLLVRGLPGEED
jgi:hypothetical protein